MLAGAVFLGNFFLHKRVSDLCDGLSAHYGFKAYNRGALLLITGVSVLALAPWLRRVGRCFRQPAGIAVGFFLVAVTVAAHRWLLVANIELIHFPQYGLLTAMLLFGGLTPEVAWLGAAFSGVLDEVYQHLVIYAGRPDTYLDYNDMVLNMIGAAWVVVLVAAARSGGSAGEIPACSQSRWPAVACVMPLSILLTLAADPPQLHPFFRHAATGVDYHVLSAGEALAWATVLWLLIGRVSSTSASAITPGLLTDAGDPAAKQVKALSQPFLDAGESGRINTPR